MFVVDVSVCVCGRDFDEFRASILPEYVSIDQKPCLVEFRK